MQFSKQDVKTKMNAFFTLMSNKQRHKSTIMGTSIHSNKRQFSAILGWRRSEVLNQDVPESITNIGISFKVSIMALENPLAYCFNREKL
ncbi:unnamed protein product [Lupinus luteus]|uniref:Uncharacterized protein n=1 Tax=Lupinus luteus TaxID=3873 RepID=A0AAV1WEU8_LUPLU